MCRMLYVKIKLRLILNFYCLLALIIQKARRINLYVGYKKINLNFILIRYVTNKTVVVPVD